MEQHKLLVSSERMMTIIEQFANFGRTKNNGVTRLALSQEDQLARDYFCKCCEELGMPIMIDDMGNIYATLAGIEEKPPIVIGSHLDTVKQGGRFDGVLGVIAGLEVARVLVENNINPRIPLIIANITNEEGARFEPSMMSSGVLSGKFDKSTMLKKMDSDGITFENALHSIGYEGKKEFRLKEATAFLELHIEQGPILERESLSIGIVECVLGMVCYEVEVTGESDHAGTTPMEMRKDALFASNNLISEARQKLSALDTELVFTIGRMKVLPNIHTVIPNKVVFSLEARHKDPSVIKQVEDIIIGLQQTKADEGCNIKTQKLWDRSTVLFDEKICDSLEQSTKNLNYSYKRMVSGAGHDAQFLANYIPAAMIFVPSINGKSHCEEELTTWEDCAKGVNVLLETVLNI
jgi:beta-ureidopropionase / N-carbamoyl-L-amino-acid hydrolase